LASGVAARDVTTSIKDYRAGLGLNLSSVMWAWCVVFFLLGVRVAKQPDRPFVGTVIIAARGRLCDSRFAIWSATLVWPQPPSVAVENSVGCGNDQPTESRGPGTPGVFFSSCFCAPFGRGSRRKCLFYLLWLVFCVFQSLYNFMCICRIRCTPTGGQAVAGRILKFLLQTGTPRGARPPPPRPPRPPRPGQGQGPPHRTSHLFFFFFGKHQSCTMFSAFRPTKPQAEGRKKKKKPRAKRKLGGTPHRIGVNWLNLSVASGRAGHGGTRCCNPRIPALRRIHRTAPATGSERDKHLGWLVGSEKAERPEQEEAAGRG